MTPLFSQNLVVNGGAENPLGAEWVEEIGNDWQQSTFGGWVGTAEGNYHFFSGGCGAPDPVVRRLAQYVDVSAYATEIDAGMRAFRFSGWMATYPDVNDDQSRIIVEYMDNTLTVLSTYNSGLTAYDPWQQVTDTRFAPVGTRYVKITLEAVKLHGCDNDGYFDDIVLEPACVGGTTTISTNTICEGESAVLSVTGQSGQVNWIYSYDGGLNWAPFGGNGTSQDVNPALNPAFTDSPVLLRPIMLENGGLTCWDSTSNDVTLTVNQGAVGGTLSASSTVLCEGDDVDLTLSGENGTRQWQESYSGGGFSDFGADVATQNMTPTVAQSPAVYRVVTTVGGCTDTSNTVSITINPDAVGGTTSIDIDPICEGESAVVSLSGESGTIQWQESFAGGAFNNFGTGANAETVSPTFAQNPAVFRAILTSGSCTDTSSTVSLTINESAIGGTVTPTGISICHGDSLDLTLNGLRGVIQWQRSLAGGPFTDFSTPDTTITVSPTGSDSPALYRAIVIHNGLCADTSDTASILIDQPLGGLTSISTAQVCDGESATLSLTGQFGFIQWQENLNGGGWTNFSTNTTTEIVTPNVSESIAEYRVVASIGACTDTSNVSQLQIDTAAVAGTINIIPDTLCEGNSTNLTNVGANDAIQWQRSLAGGPFTNFGSGLSTESINPTEANSEAFYRAIVTKGTCVDTSNLDSLTIVYVNGGTTSISSGQICDGESVTLSLTGDAGNVQWQENLAGGGFTNFGSGGAAEVVTPNVSESIAEYRVVASIGSCSSTSNTVQVQIDTAAIAGTIDIVPDTLCEGSTTNLVNTGANDAIQWQQSLAGGPWTDFGTGLTTESLNPTASNSEAFYRAIITKGICIDTSNIDSLTIINVTPGTTNIMPSTICDGDNATVTISGQSGALQWQQNLNGGGWTNFGGGGTSEIVSPNVSESIAEYRVLVSAGGCTDTSTVSQLQVDTAAIAGTVDIIPDTLCEGSSTTLSNTGANGTIQWQHNLNGAGWTNFGTGLANETINPVSSESEAFYRAIVTKTICVDTSTLDSLTIINVLGGTTSLGSIEICDGESTTVDITGENGSIQWQESLAGGPFTNFGTGGSTEIIAPTNAQSPAIYRAQISIGSCSNYSATSTLTINPAATGGTPSIVSDSICNGSSENLTISGHNGTIQWQESLAGGAFTNFGSGLNPETISPTPADNMALYRAIITLGTCTDTSTIDSLFVIDVDAGTITPGQASICDGTGTTLTLSGNLGTIQWQDSLGNSNFTNFGTGLGTENINPIGADIPAYYRAVVTNFGCTDTTSLQFINVETAPGAPGTITGNTIGCDGDTLSFNVPTQSDASSFTWTATNGTVISGQGTTGADIQINSTSTTIEVYPVNSCGTGTTPSTLVVTGEIYPTPIILNNDTTICDGDSYTMIATETSGLPAGQLTYQWYNTSGIISGETNSSLLISSQDSYEVVITNNGLCATVSSPVNTTLVTVDVDAGPTQYINPGEAVTLAATSNGSYSYSWSPATSLSSDTVLNPVASPTTDMIYQITATSTEGCTDTSSVAVNVQEFISPSNVFTPNNDGSHDIWELTGIEGYPNHKVEIFNRWGNRVFVSTNFTGWDGRRNGELLPVATYYYIITLGGDEPPVTGSVSIVR